GEARGVTLGEARGEARGKVGGKREAVVSFLQARFGKVPQKIVHAVNACSDTSDLDVLTVSAATCKTLKEFAAGLK
ncbi:MAG: hypothetical protein LBH00_01165, partial [Planctomycetaceae bacterium]|nr:hypothetical protein [Planctomycetaceae bacterium]